jgi:hypothetical protein
MKKQPKNHFEVYGELHRPRGEEIPPIHPKPGICVFTNWDDTLLAEITLHGSKATREKVASKIIDLLGPQLHVGSTRVDKGNDTDSFCVWLKSKSKSKMKTAVTIIDKELSRVGMPRGSGRPNEF